MLSLFKTVHPWLEIPSIKVRFVWKMNTASWTLEKETFAWTTIYLAKTFIMLSAVF